MSQQGNRATRAKVRWSEMENAAKELRRLYPTMPSSVVLAKYWLKTTDPQKLEQRRHELAQYWRGVMDWLATPEAQASCLSSAPIQQLLDTGRIREQEARYESRKREQEARLHEQEDILREQDTRLDALHSQVRRINRHASAMSGEIM